MQFLSTFPFLIACFSVGLLAIEEPIGHGCKEPTHRLCDDKQTCCPGNRRCLPGCPPANSPDVISVAMVATLTSSGIAQTITNTGWATLTTPGPVSTAEIIAMRVGNGTTYYTEGVPVVVVTVTLTLTPTYDANAAFDTHARNEAGAGNGVAGVVGGALLAAAGAVVLTGGL